MMTAAPDEGFI